MLIVLILRIPFIYEMYIRVHNRTLIHMLSTFVKENYNDWDDHLPYILMAYRATAQSSTGCSPNLVMLGRETTCPLDIIMGLPSSGETVCKNQYVGWLRNSMRDSFGFVRDNLAVAAQRQKNY